MAKHWMVKRNILMLDGYVRHSPIIGLYPHCVPITLRSTDRLLWKPWPV